jgi:hypothetical protein
MPWCEPCGRFLNPNSMGSDGTCPSCGRVLADPSASAAGGTTTATKVPWHFWLLVAAMVLYLGWRAVQGIGWVAAHL